MVVKGASFGRSFTPCITSAFRFAGFLGYALMQSKRKDNGEWLKDIQLLAISFVLC
jgi:hypothetical protein